MVGGVVTRSVVVGEVVDVVVKTFQKKNYVTIDVFYCK
jgi:hypothetical protein